MRKRGASCIARHVRVDVVDEGLTSACLCVKTLQCQQHQRHHINRLPEKSKPSVCWDFFLNLQELEIIVLAPPNPGTSSCRVNWYGWSTWFQSLGKLVPWRDPPPLSWAGQTQMTHQRNSPSRHPETDVQTGRNKSTSKYSRVSSRGPKPGIID